MRIFHKPTPHTHVMRMMPAGLYKTFAAFFVGLVAMLSGCADTGGLGASCDSNSECKSDLQCVNQACVPRCERASECGDGYECSASGLCESSRGVEGSSCDSETDCSAGLFCKLDGGDEDNDGALRASCATDQSGHAIGQECVNDGQCRNGTCALGHCVDLCSKERDCPRDMTCLTIPRIEAGGALFRGCLPERGVITWNIPVSAPAADVLVPIPTGAVSLSLAMSVADDSQLVGATYLTSPRNDELFRRIDPTNRNKLRHTARPSLSLLQLPSSSMAQLEPGAYHLSLSSLRPNGQTGSATPRLRASLRTGPVNNNGIPTDNAVLALHFHFLDLTDHPCRAGQFAGAPGKETLNAENVRSSDKFLDGYVRELRSIFQGAGVALGSITYDDLKDTPSLDNVTPENLRALLALGRYATGINVFLVRGISPVGVVAMGPTPGTAGVKGTSASGVVISLEPLCYGSWSQLARTTAHQLARYMGLFPNRDVAGVLDPISDTDGSADNLMFFSEGGGTKFSAGQRSILVASPMVEGSAAQ
jgi:hypothetical protein